MQTTELQVALGQEWPKAQGAVFCASQHVLVELSA
jgi:hypothetical protein